MYIYNEFLKYKISCIGKNLLKFCFVDMFLLSDIVSLPREYCLSIMMSLTYGSNALWLPVYGIDFLSMC
jgi:hypothetical protein